MTSRRLLVAILALPCAVAAVVAVGARAGSVSAREHAPWPNGLAPAREEVLPVPQPHPKGPRCTRAKVMLADPAGAIDFTVRCAAPVRPGRARFWVQRYSMASSKSGSGIKAFRRSPPVVGVGAVRAHGKCWRHKPSSHEPLEIDCRASVRGPVIVHGRIWVDPARRCAMGVLIGTPKICYRMACGDDLAVRTLAKGRPQGC